MKLKRAFAAAMAASLAASGLLLGGTAASAAPPPARVMLGDIAVPTDAATESAHYNTWHFDPAKGPGDTAQARNGLSFAAGADVQVLKGNGNDIAKTDPGARPDATSIADLAASLDVVSSNDAAVSLQIPVFYGHDGGAPGAWKFTTLRQSAAATDDVWTTSQAIAGSGFAVNGSGSLADLVAALGADARPIAAGFLVHGSQTTTLVSSFTANGETTRFYAAPASTTAPQGDPAAWSFVPASAIRTDNATYPGWHEEVAADNPARGGFERVVIGDDVFGLQVTGKSQLVYGYAEDARPQNSLIQILDAGTGAGGFVIDGVAGAGTAGFEAQVPVFFYPEGAEGPQFTTLRTVIPEYGAPITAAQPWASSRDLGSVPANVYTDLDSILAALGDYEILGHGFTVESGSAIVNSVSFNGHASTFTEVTVPAPSEDDLYPVLEGRITAPATAVAGSTIEVGFADADDAEYFSGETVNAYLFSDPIALGSAQVAAGRFQVTLPAGVTGTHRLAVYGTDGWIIGWTSIAIGAGSGTTGGDGTAAGAGTGAASGTGAKRLAATGAAETWLPLAALGLAAAGAGALLLRRRNG